MIHVMNHLMCAQELMECVEMVCSYGVLKGRVDRVCCSMVKVWRISRYDIDVLVRY